jgi:prolyl 4-hydroxylase
MKFLLTTLFLLITTVVGSEIPETQGECVNEECLADADTSTCVDQHQNCPLWSTQGKCQDSKAYMETYCQKSCGVCGSGSNSTENVDMGVTQIIDAKLATEIQNRIAASQEYVNMISKDPQYKKLMELCKNNHESCAFWSVIGECEKNPGYMKTKCSPSCFSCDQLSVETRCPINLTETPNIWEPGDVNKFFTNLTTMDEYKQYGVKVLSAPDYLPGDSAEKEVDYLVNGPWAVLLENFISDEEADRLIELGAAEGYERSSDVGKEKADGTFDHHIGYGRTSHNSWCQKECYKDPVAQRVIERITNVTNIPEANSEYLQMLRYEVGEHYQTHHDYIPHQLQRQSGVRILTVYMYLNDVEEGGGTSFTNLGPLTVTPKKGAALIWPSVLDERPHTKDERTMHAALPVIKGVKYGANAWIHQRDFKTPNRNNCN